MKKPTWQQATALVSLSTCGAMTGFTFAPGTVADMTSPTSMPVHLMALATSATPTASNDSALRSAIVSVARYYLQMARSKTPAQMEALIWQADSTDGADHGQSCAAFASLTLALGAQAVGQQSWVSGGGSYPWPLHRWADVRVQPNPASPNVVSMLQDAQAHHRWHPLGDGYQPQPGDWVLFDGHVEVVTRYTGAALYTVGGDSLPNLTVNAHKFPAPLAAQGVLGFVNNGDLVSTVGQDGQSGRGGSQVAADAAQVPGVTSQMVGAATREEDGSAAIPGTAASTLGGGSSAGQHAPSHTRHNQPPTGVPGTAAQQAFISLVAPGAIAAQQRYGIPAAVTIAQAIDESGWGQSELATADHNLFGIKGTGPAGSDTRPTQEYENGIWVTRTAPFRVYHNIAESIADHSQLLATDQAYQHAMAARHVPDAFAAALTGVYATDPNYGSNLIALMRLYNLYRYDSATPTAAQAVAPLVPQVAGQQAAVPGVLAPGASAGGGSGRWRTFQAGWRRVDLGAASGRGLGCSWAIVAPGGTERFLVGRARRGRGSGRGADAAEAATAAGAADRAQGLADEHPPLCVADSAGGHRQLRRDGQGPADPGAAAVPGCCLPYRDLLGAAGGLRLDAVPGPAALLAGTWREAGYVQSGRDGVPDQVGGVGPVCQ